MEEIMILKNNYFFHPNVIHLIGVCVDPLSIITQFYSEGIHHPQ
jgi:hypothetical protein